MISFKASSYWVLRYKTGELVGIDSHSGGYPFKVQMPHSIFYWNTSDQAKDYASMFLKEIDLQPIQVFGLFELDDTK